MRNFITILFTIFVLLSSGLVFPIQSVYAAVPNDPTGLIVHVMTIILLLIDNCTCHDNNTCNYN